MDSQSCSPSLHSRFVAILPRVIGFARKSFRAELPLQREELIQETTAVCWFLFVRLAQRGKDPAEFASALGGYAVRRVRSGRKLAGSERAQEILSRWSQKRLGFRVQSLSDDAADDSWQESIRGNTTSSVADQAAFRIDFPRWIGRQSRRDRRIIREMLCGERTQTIARKFQLTPGRISQLRRQLHASWQDFHGERARPRRVESSTAPPPSYIQIHQRRSNERSVR